MKIRLDSLKPEMELIQKQPSKHTIKLHIIIVKGIHEGYNYNKKQHYCYITIMTKMESYYPASNSPKDKPHYLDGVFGTITLAQLKKEYIINE